MIQVARLPFLLAHVLPSFRTPSLVLATTGCGGEAVGVCAGILKSCRLVSGCMHRFCADCIEKWLRVARCNF